MKKQLLLTASLLMATQAFSQQQPSTPASSPAVNPYYLKQVQGMSLENLSQKDREKFQQGYDNFTNSAKMTDKTIKPIATYGWRLNKAWPTLVNPQQVTWADQDILRLQVTFTYKYWDRK